MFEQIDIRNFSYKHISDVPLIVEIANTELELIAQCEKYAELNDYSPNREQAIKRLIGKMEYLTQKLLDNK